MSLGLEALLLGFVGLRKGAACMVMYVWFSLSEVLRRVAVPAERFLDEVGGCGYSQIRLSCFLLVVLGFTFGLFGLTFAISREFGLQLFVSLLEFVLQ